MMLLNKLSDLLGTSEYARFIAALLLMLIGWLLGKLLPALFRGIWKLLVWLGKHIGGRFAFKHFEGTYLNWLVTELRELKLTGIVNTDSAKKPKLDQVFVSLRVGHQPNQNMVIEAAVAVSEEARHRKSLDAAIIRGLRRDLELAGSAERKDAERIILSFLRKRSLARPYFGRRKQVATSDDALLTEFFDTAKLMSDKASAEYAAMLLRHVLWNEERIAILGSPGAGKTTLLQYIGLAYARARAGEKRLRERNRHKKQLGAAEWRLPVFVPLGSIAKLLAERRSDGTTRPLTDVLPTVVPPDLQDNCKRYFLRQLKRGKCILLFDGLDEVPSDDEFRAVVQAIEGFANKFPKNRFILTSRVAGWRTGIHADFKQYYISDLSDEEVEFFVNTWCSAVELNAVSGPLDDEDETDRANRERRAAKAADNLQKAIRETPGIRQLANNPMLLSIIALVHRSLTNLPQERSKLYADCTKILLDQWDLARGLRVDDTKLRLDQKETIMRRLAFALHRGEIGEATGGREATREEFEKVLAEILPTFGRQSSDASHLLNRLIERSGVIIERRRDILAFAHLSFQEYFVARYLARTDRSEFRNFLLDSTRLNSSWWREVILLYSGMLADSSEFLSALYGVVAVDSAGRSARLLGGCLGEAVQVRNAGIRQLIADELLRIRTRAQFIGFATPASEDLIQYLVACSKRPEWITSAVIANCRLLRERENNNFSRGLLDILESQDKEDTLALLIALPEIDKPLINSEIVTHIRQLAENGTAQEKGLAIQAFTSMELNEDVATLLANALVGGSNVVEVLKACERIGPKVLRFPVLSRAVCRYYQKNANWRIREQLAKLFPVMAGGAEGAEREGFVRLLGDDDSDVRDAAKRSLMLVSSEERRWLVKLVLKQLVRPRDGDGAAEYHLFAFISSLRELSAEDAANTDAVNMLVELLSSKHQGLRVAARRVLKALAERGLAQSIAEAVSRGCAAVGDSSVAGDVTLLTISACHNYVPSIDALVLGAARSHREELRCAAAEALKDVQQIDFSQRLELLLSLCRDRKPAVRAAALDSLGHLAGRKADSRIVNALEQGLEDSRLAVNAAAAESAGRLGKAGAALIDRLVQLACKKPAALLRMMRGSYAKAGLIDVVRYYTWNMWVTDDMGTWHMAAACSALAKIGLATDGERVVSALVELASSPERQDTLLVQPVIVALGEIGQKYPSARLLDVVLSAAERSYAGLATYLRQETVQSSESGLFITPVTWSGRAFAWGDFESAAVVIARKLQVKDAVKCLKSALEESVPTRHLALSVIGALGLPVASELYSSVAKRLSDEDVQIRERAWQVLVNVSRARGQWREGSSGAGRRGATS